jgi:N6-adenosine-specific RNA methylase IME4
MAEAAEIQFKAEVKLGEMLSAAKERGELREGRPKKNDTNSESFSLKEIGLTPRESMAAQHKASISERAQLAMIERMRDKILSGGATVIDQVATTEEKKTRRENRERVLGECQAALPDKRYGVILADPEWRFEVYSRDTGMDRAADNHYPTSATDAICARPVGDIAAKDCALFLWATVPMLPDALRVMEAWGFQYKSHCIWAKDRPGTGYWFRNMHELLLVGTRGDVPAPAMGTQAFSFQPAPLGEHSAKPECFLEMIEAYFPTLPKIELNRRGPARPGWDAWGNERIRSPGRSAGCRAARSRWGSSARALTLPNGPNGNWRSCVPAPGVSPAPSRASCAERVSGARPTPSISSSRACAATVPTMTSTRRWVSPNYSASTKAP